MNYVLTAFVVMTASFMLRAEKPNITLPKGFVIDQVCGPDQANDIYTIHIDSQGRMLVAGRGYIRQVLEHGRTVDLVTGVKAGPMGLLWEGTTLYAVVDGGLQRWTNVVEKLTNHDRPMRILTIKTGGEHDAHAIRRGPDGKLYLLCGNNAGVSGKMITSPNSPISHPVAGALIRFNDDGTEVEVLGDGFRNAYDFDFDCSGFPHTFDSDNERCVGLPWYEQTRFYRILPGSNFGWMNPQYAQTWRKPPYFPDVSAPLATVGRGSPTGCVCYRHTQFPKYYQRGFFLGDWTFGKVWYVPEGGTPEPFLEPIGESGFAPTALAVHPITGDLYVSIGGRGTRGSVFRVSYTLAQNDCKPIPMNRHMNSTKRIPMDPPKSMDFRSGGIELLRAWQIQLGGLVDTKLNGTVWEGYSFRKPVSGELRAKLLTALRSAYPSKDHNEDREITRCLAALQDDDPASVERIVSNFSQGSDPVEDIHYLIVLSRLSGNRSDMDRERIATALVSLDRKFESQKLTRDRHWPTRLVETTRALIKHDPKLEKVILKHPLFGDSSQIWLAQTVDRKSAATRFLERARANKDYEWTPAVVELMKTLEQDEVRSIIPALLRQGGLIDSVIPLISSEARIEDRELFRSGLQSFQPRTLTLSARSLLAMPADEGELPTAYRALNHLGDMTEERDARNALISLLKKQTGQSHSTSKDWMTWIEKNRPNLAKQIASSGVDRAAWAKRFARLNWDSGDLKRGRAVFAKASCAACHNGAQAIGPSLDGVTKRFGRDDLLTAMIDPNRDVSPRYRTTEIQTLDGKSYRGVVIYEAVDGVILHTGTTETVRIAGDNIESQKLRATSLMPSGLLDSLTDREIEDLMAYLKSLQPAK